MMIIDTGTRRISAVSPTYFVADIAANHDGSLERALMLIRRAADAGADAVKFQNFRAETIVSRKGFAELGGKLTHQAKWDKDVFEVYKDAELPVEWTDELIAECKRNGIDYFTAPYDLSFIGELSSKMPALKIGSGDISWKESIELMISLKKPIMLATGASEMWEVRRAVELINASQIPLVLMQCNTNYTGEEGNFDNLNLLVLNEYEREFPECILGLSDHSPGHIAVLGAVALGARVVEKHFTDDVTLSGPDHGFSLDSEMWQKMVEDTRILERCLGSGEKKVEPNESDARVVQRRALRFVRNMDTGEMISETDLIALRPCPSNGIDPWEKSQIVGRELTHPVESDELVTHEHFR